MHVISNERALAHWRALCGLPDGMMNRLCNRFAHNQPQLAATLLTFSGSVTADPDGNPVLRPSGDSDQADEGRLIETAAMLAELFQREAGHPLRQLEADVIQRLIETNLELFTQFREADENNCPESAPRLVDDSSQPNLLGGILAATRGNPEIKPERLMLEFLLSRVMIEGLHQACGDEATPDANDWDTERILIALSAQGDPMRREALKACDSFRAELTREFILELERWTNDPRTVNDEDVSLGMHALYLLAKWRETSAWPVFRKLFSLPGRIGYQLMGDVITEYGSILLAMVGGNHADELREMVESESLDEFCRGACLEALTCLVAWGELSRDEHIGYLRALLTGRLSAVPENDFTFSNVVAAAMNMEAWELSPEIESAFARELVAEDVCDLQEFRNAKKQMRSIEWQEFCERHPPVTDVAETTDWLDEPPMQETSSLSQEDAGVLVAESDQPYIAPPKVGRNEPCPCGSGKKYKKCCGK